MKHVSLHPMYWFISNSEKWKYTYDFINDKFITNYNDRHRKFCLLVKKLNKDLE